MTPTPAHLPAKLFILPGTPEQYEADKAARRAFAARMAAAERDDDPDSGKYDCN